MDFETILKVGLSGQVTEGVEEKNTARALGSGGLAVYATPSMVALMEKAAVAALADLLPAEYSTVGTVINITHSSATPPGMTVRASAELTGIDGRRLIYRVEAFDEAGKIGEGSHERFIITVDKFLKKTREKLSGADTEA